MDVVIIQNKIYKKTVQRIFLNFTITNLCGHVVNSCDLDPAPTFLVKEFLDPLLPFLTRLCNVSLREGRLPSSQTTVIVTPALKKPGLDPSDMKNYRPISNLSSMSKIVERIVVRQLSEYLAANSLLPKLQSGFRRHHSTESALIRVLSDLFMATDKGEVSLLALLDVSAAFDTVDQITPSCWTGCPFHTASRDRLSTGCGHLLLIAPRTVHYGGRRSRCVELKSGVAQGSVLGPLLYVLYTADIQKLVHSLGFDVHMYADDTQFHGSCMPSGAADLAARSMCVISAVKD